MYFNAEYVRGRLLDLVAQRPDPVRLVVLSLSAVPNVDLAGAELLANLHSTFRARSIDFRLADVHGELRDALRRIGFDAEYGPLESGRSIDAELSQWLARGSCSPEQP